jgi:hypothetical protein
LTASALKNSRPFVTLAVVLHVVGHNVRVLRIAHRDVENFFVGRKGDAVWKSEILDEQADLAIRGDAEDAVERQFLERRFVQLSEAVRRVGEINLRRSCAERGRLGC